MSVLPEIALAGLRVATGSFFVLSGYHKLFNAERHKTITDTLVKDGIPFVSVNQWFVPCVELMAGLAVTFGLLTQLAALGLLVICLMATCVDGLKRIPAWKPLDKGDYADDVLYLPEVIYMLILAVFVAGGAGQFSLDAYAGYVLAYMF